MSEAYCVPVKLWVGFSAQVCLRLDSLFAQVTPVSYSLITRMEIQWELSEWTGASS